MLKVKTIPFQTIQFNINSQFISIWPKDRALLGTTTPGQSGLGSDGNEEVLRILYRSSITGTSPSDFLVLYQDIHGGVTSFVEMQSVYSTASVDWTVYCEMMEIISKRLFCVYLWMSRKCLFIDREHLSNIQKRKVKNDDGHSTIQDWKTA